MNRHPNGTHTFTFISGAKFIILSNALAFILQLLLHSLVVHYIGLEDYGYIILLQTIYYILIYQTIDSIFLSTVRFGGENLLSGSGKTASIANTSLSLSQLFVVAGLVVTILAWIFGLEFRNYHIGWGLTVFCLIGGVETIVLYTQSLWMIEKRFATVSIVRFVYAVLRFGFATSAAWLFRETEYAVRAVLIAFLLSSFVVSMISFFLERKRIRLLVFSIESLRSIYKYILQTAGIMFMKQIASRSYDLMMASWYNTASISKFRIGITIGRSLNQLYDPISQVVFSIGSVDLGKKDSSSHREAIYETSRNMGAVLIPVAIIGHIVIKPFVSLFFPALGDEGVIIAQLMIWLSAIDGIVFTAGPVIRIYRNGLMLWLTMFNAAIVLASGWFVITHYTLLTTAWTFFLASTLTSFVGFTAGVIVLKKHADVPVEYSILRYFLLVFSAFVISHFLPYWYGIVFIILWAILFRERLMLMMKWGYNMMRKSR